MHSCSQGGDEVIVFFLPESGKTGSLVSRNTEEDNISNLRKKCEKENFRIDEVIKTGKSNVFKYFASEMKKISLKKSLNFKFKYGFTKNSYIKFNKKINLFETLSRFFL